MFRVDEQPETLHIYVVREEAPKPQFFPIFFSVLALASLVALPFAVPYQQPVTRLTIRVPAVPFAIRMFTAQVAITPTGVTTYPATTAHGILTITNGSIIGQSIPAGFTIQGVATDYAVYVPGGNANGYGWAQVQAHAVVVGKQGNVSPYSINSVVGSSVYVRNLSAFSGGRDAYSVKYTTAQDRREALMKARAQLVSMTSGLHYPCKESQFVGASLQIIWRCQFVTYQLPQYLHVTVVTIFDKNLLIHAWFVAHSTRIWVK